MMYLAEHRLNMIHIEYATQIADSCQSSRIYHSHSSITESRQLCLL